MDSKRILLAEDEVITAMDVTWHLKAMGHTVIGTVSNGIAAIEKATQLIPDLLIMDINLKGEMTGVEAFTQIQKTIAIPVIFTTGYEISQIQQIESAVPVKYISKPFEPEEIQTIIENIFSESEIASL